VSLHEFHFRVGELLIYVQVNQLADDDVELFGVGLVRQQT
jgi:hypothetical protein